MIELIGMAVILASLAVGMVMDLKFHVENVVTYWILGTICGVIGMALIMIGDK